MKAPTLDQWLVQTRALLRPKRNGFSAELADSEDALANEESAFIAIAIAALALFIAGMALLCGAF